MRVWITKYALTDGILEADAFEETAGMVVDRSTMHAQFYHGEGREWHRTLKGAQAQAEKMRLNKIKSLKKSLDKFEALRF